jgi:hypothetical protein
MPSQLVSSSGCCQPCDSEPIVVNIPGPQGPAGTNGTNGTDGIDSFTYTTAPFFVPALGSSVLVFVDNTDFLPESVAGQFFVSIQGLGYMQVLSVDGLQLTLQNPAAGVLGIANAVPTTLIPTNSLITLAGAIGPTGAPGASGGAPVGATYICRTADATLTSETALDSLSAGYLKTQGSSGSGAVSTVATIPIADVTGTVPIAKGGTNLTTAPLNKIPVGDGTTYLQKEIVGTLPIVVTNSAGNITLSAPSIAPFNYVTFTRRIATTGSGNVPLLAAGTTANPYNATTFPPPIGYSGIDTASGFTAADGRFTVPYTGYYRLTAYFNFIGSSGTARTTIYLRKNGVSVLTSYTFDVSSSGYHPISVDYIDNATSTSDYYEVYVNTTSHSLNIEQGSSFSVQRIQA